MKLKQVRTYNAISENTTFSLNQFSFGISVFFCTSESSKLHNDFRILT